MERDARVTEYQGSIDDDEVYRERVAHFTHWLMERNVVTTFPRIDAVAD